MLRGTLRNPASAIPAESIRWRSMCRIPRTHKAHRISRDRLELLARSSLRLLPPQLLHKSALPQPREAAVVMVSNIANRLPQLVADLMKIQSLEVKQLQG